MSTGSTGGEKPLVVLAHAYSPQNAGDGLLVDLAKKQILEAIGQANVVTVALNARAFGGDDFVQWGAHDSSRVPARFNMLAAAIVGVSGRIRRLFADADLIVAVGGGYLRGGGVIESLKSWGAHYSQLRSIADHGQKAVYLPQSIGPFVPGYASLVKKQLKRIAVVHLRDDRSVSELGDMPGVRRSPDLAVLEMAATRVPARAALARRRPVLVVRELSRPRSYRRFLTDASRDGRFDWAVQSTGRGNDDLPITLRYSPTRPRMLSEVLAQDTSSVVVSTRLHGSMAALLAGYPTIHLSYERKGWGAFEDLGLPRYVLNAREVRLGTVLELIEEIESDPARYWQAIDDRMTTIQEGSIALKRSLQQPIAVGNR